MCTGSRPSTSSTRTSRTWRASAPRVCSSSNTVGSVRTGIPRARHSRTIRARVEPGAEGIAMITSSGSASSRMRGRSLFGVAAHADALDPQAALARVVVEEADRDQAELAVAHDLAHDHAAALAGARDQDRALALAPAAEGGQRAPLVDAARERAHADEEHEREQREQHDHPVGEHDRDGAPMWIAVYRAQHLDRHDREQHDHDHRAHERLVVALARVAPAALVDAREHEHGHAAQQHPPDRDFAQLRVVPGGPLLKRSWKAR